MARSSGPGSGTGWPNRRPSEIIGSGIQVVQDYDIDTEWEGWGDSPHERERLFRLIREMGVPGVVFVSGDMHFSELTRHPDDAAALGYPTYDLTPSGLDQIETAGEGQWINPNRIGELLNSNRKHGMVEIDWAPPDPEIHLEIYDGRDLFVHHVVRLSELQAGRRSGLSREARPCATSRTPRRASRG